ncbi:MAG: GNAT family N-acetyltransferase [Bacteriovorax sp.]|nr:GNAT family N-acetyltransferase [Bacteriovorax sp.]
MTDFKITVIEGHHTLSSEMAFVLFELDRLFFPTPWGLESWELLFHEHDRYLITLSTDNIVVGFCLFDKAIGDSFSHLLKILVHPDYRSIGLAFKLLSKAEEDLRVLGCSEFFLEVEESNYAAQKLYQNIGFQIIHRKKDFYGLNRSALIMTKGITPTNKSHS